MITLDRRMPPGTKASVTVTLTYEARRKSRQKVTLDGGEEAGVVLPWGESLRHGDLIASSSGLVVRIVAAHEPVMLVRASHPRELARVAYHLGNRHVAVEVLESMLKIAPDHVLRAMCEGLGAQVELATQPFEPEAGAYGGHVHGPAASRFPRRPGGTKQVS
jgi:urease accessory protein